MERILHYFPNLSEKQISQFSQLGDLYAEWNQKINVISRKDIDNLYIHHVLHSLAIAKFMKFNPEAEVMDLGTGGGFPGIPLAIIFPATKFTLIDGTRKKITVVKEVAEAIGLENVKAIQMRAEEHKHKYDFVITRAVAKLNMLVEWSFKLIKKTDRHIMPNGIIALKGGNLKEEILELPQGNYTEVVPLETFFDEAFFDTKFLIYVQGE